MYLMMTMLITIILIISVTSILIIFLSKKTIMDNQKSTPFECGFNPMSYTRVPFSIHFFLIAVIFLIFDVEIILIMPMILTTKTSSVTTFMITSIIFITILILGLYHEWKNGMLNWTD